MDSPDILNHTANILLIFDLLIDEPLQEGMTGVILFLCCQAVQVVNIINDLMFMF
jgi:hypothetical protein